MSAAARLIGLIGLISETTVYDLGRPMRNGMAQSPNHPRFTTVSIGSTATGSEPTGARPQPTCSPPAAMSARMWTLWPM